jgi:hypothetical protein
MATKLADVPPLAKHILLVALLEAGFTCAQ